MRCGMLEYQCHFGRVIAILTIYISKKDFGGARVGALPAYGTGHIDIKIEPKNEKDLRDKIIFITLCKALV